MEQITINYSPGLVESFDSCREFVAHRVHQQGRSQKSIAADMDYSPSHLTRKCAQSPDDSMRFTLDDLERFIQVTGDDTPLVWLVARYMGDSELDRLKARIAELEGAG